ncbi:MAG: hypothetical protein H6Q89_813 [Myxococcaceae bacterium]|nr:hypothetical protein [Myxococcaceae bacterium]
MPEFSHLEPSRILVVAGEARRASHATVKPLAFGEGLRTDALGRHKPLVKVAGKRMLYCITLRPLFFRSSGARERVATVLHELFHISTAFDGTLDSTRRHSSMGKRFAVKFLPLERRLWRGLPPELLAPFAHDGDVRVLQWLERPSAWLPGEKASSRRIYTEAHLFIGVIRMKTRRAKAVRSPPTHEKSGALH